MTEMKRCENSIWRGRYSTQCDREAKTTVECMGRNRRMCHVCIAAKKRGRAKTDATLAQYRARAVHIEETTQRKQAEYDALLRIKDAAQNYYDFTREPVPPGFDNDYNQRGIKVGAALQKALAAASEGTGE